MNILIYLDRYPGFGGVETVTTTLSNAFAGNGYRVVILSVQQKNSELLQQLDQRVELLKLPNTELLSNENKVFLINQVNNLNIDLIIHQHSYALIFDLIVSVRNKLNCKIITVEHNTPDAQIKMYTNHLKEEHYNKNIKFNIQKFFYPFFILKCKLKERRRHRYLYKHSDRYILLSEKFVSVFKQLTKLNTCDKLSWIPNPIVKTQDVLELNKEKIILYVGRIDKPHKRVDRLISIFERLSSEFPDWKLVVVGDGPYRNELERYVNSNNIKQVYFEGFQSQLSQYYKKTTIFCLTSNVEGWGLVLVEAMQFGVIPFSYDSYASVYDIIDNGVNGFIIPSFDQDLYTNSLRLLIQNEDLQKEMALKAKDKSLSFTDDKIIMLWEKMFQKLLQ